MIPKTYLVGYTDPNWYGISSYLKDTNQEEFEDTLNEANCDVPLRLCSMFAKLCYKSLVLGKNKNITKTRDIEDNIKSIIDSGHGSVLEHISFNFITTNCSRVFSHELVRHRVGTAFSQTSGRYCAIDENSQIVLDDPILEKYWLEEPGLTGQIQHEEITIKRKLEILFQKLKDDIIKIHKTLPDNMPFSEKKKITSALRRIAPNGQTNEIAWTANLRALRHMIEMRTSPHAEWEIRQVFMEVANILKRLDELYLYGGTENKDGSWSNLRV